MSITYATTGITQNDSTITGNTSSANSTYNTSTLETTITFSSLSGVVAGMRVVLPASIAGSEVLTASATSITVFPGTPTSIPTGTTFTFIDSDGILADNPTNGLGLTLVGAGKLAQRMVRLSGSSTQFNINGSYTIDATRNRYSVVGSASQIGFSVNGTLNIVGTNNKTNTGLALSGGQICVIPNSQPANSESINTTFVIRGILNMRGAGYWGDSPWALDTVGGGIGAAGCVVNLVDSIIRLGVSSAGALNTIYADAYRGTSLASRFTFNATRVQVVDTYLKFLSVRTSSIFQLVNFFKTIPQTNAQNTNLDIAIAIAPLIATDSVGFNFVGLTFGRTGNTNSYYNTHLAIGNTSSNTNAPTAVRNTMYGYEIGVRPAIGKVVDFPSARAWVEIRKNLQLNLLNTNGTSLSSGDAGIYLEDANLNTGQLATIHIFALNGQNTGFTDGTYTSNAGVIPGSGTGGSITITISGGRVVNAVITAVGSGYTATNGSGISLQVNASNFTGVGTGTCFLIIYPYVRLNSYATGNNPDFSGNRKYIADTNGSGTINTLQTNSGSSGNTLSANNPTPPNGTAYTGIDFLIAICNAALPDAASTFGVSQSLLPIDQRWSANGNTAFNINIPIRGYKYNDSTFTFTEAIGGGATDNVINQLYMALDIYVNAIGTTEANAGLITDITLVTAQPTRSAPTSGSTTGNINQTTTGTITISTTNRNADNIYVKSKYDYTRRTLNETVGNVARTGFGISSFLNPSGATDNALLNVGSWNIDSSADILIGSTFKKIITTGTITLRKQNVLGSSYANLQGNNFVFDLGAGVSPTTIYQSLISATNIATAGLSSRFIDINTSTTLIDGFSSLLNFNFGANTGVSRTQIFTGNNGNTLTNIINLVNLSGNCVFNLRGDNILRFNGCSFSSFSGEINPQASSTPTLYLNNCGDLSSSFPFVRTSGSSININVIAQGTTILPSTLPAGFVVNGVLNINADSTSVGGKITLFSKTGSVLNQIAEATIVNGVNTINYSGTLYRAVYSKPNYPFVVVGNVSNLDLTAQNALSVVTGTNRNFTSNYSGGVLTISIAQSSNSGTDTVYNLELLKGTTNFNTYIANGRETLTNNDLWANTASNIITFNTTTIQFRANPITSSVIIYDIGIGGSLTSFNQLTTLVSGLNVYQVNNFNDIPSSAKDVIDLLIGNTQNPGALTKINSNLNNVATLTNLKFPNLN